MIRPGLIPLLLSLVAGTLTVQGSTLTEGLMRRFGEAWNSADIERIVALMQPSVYFQSPFKNYQSLKVLKNTLLVRNPPVIKSLRVRERNCFVGSAIAWSAGEIDMASHDLESGDAKGMTADYIYVFTRAPAEDWKIAMMIFVREWDNEAALGDRPGDQMRMAEGH